MVSVVGIALGPVEPRVVAHELERCRHLLVGERPAAERVVVIAAGVGEVDAERLGLGLSDERRIRIPAAEPREAPDRGKHAAEGIRSLPGDGEGTDPSRTRAADRPQRRITRERLLLRHLGQDLLEQKPGVAVAERVILERPVRVFPRARRLLLCLVVARIEKHRHRRRHFSRSDEVVEHDGHAPLAVDLQIAVAVLKDHEGRRHIGLGLRRHIDRPVAHRARKNL